MVKKTRLLLVVMYAAASWVWAAEFPLELKKMTLPDAMSCPGGGGLYGPLTVKKPPAIGKEPIARSSYPLYGLLRSSSERPIAYRLDESQGTGKGYDVVILDLNANGDLSDDPVGKAWKNPQQGQEERQSDGPAQVLFGPIEVPKDKPIGTWQPTLYAELYLFNRKMITQGGGTGNYLGHLRVKPGCYLETTVELDGVKQKIGFLDANCNMRLGDKGAIEQRTSGNALYYFIGPCDVVLRDRNGSGGFESDEFESESDPLSSLIYFGPNPYTLTLAEDLKAVRLEPYSGPVGEMAMTGGDHVKALQLCWQGQGGTWEPVTPEVSRGKFKVPVGTYCLYACVLAGEDKDGATVLAMGLKREVKDQVTVAAGKTATLHCGTPLDLQVKAEKSGPPGGLLGALITGSNTSQLRISVQTVGAGGEVYSSFAKEKTNEGRPKPPQFKILDESGKQIASGQLEYG